MGSRGGNEVGFVCGGVVWDCGIYVEGCWIGVVVIGGFVELRVQFLEYGGLSPKRVSYARAIAKASINVGGR